MKENAELLAALESVQAERLRQPTQPLPPYSQPVSKEELELAERVVTNLISMAQQVSPGNLAAVEALRKAMGVIGVDIKPPPSSSTIIERQPEPVEAVPPTVEAVPPPVEAIPPSLGAVPPPAEVDTNISDSPAENIESTVNELPPVQDSGNIVQT